jgi:hypothetical protein
MWGGLYFGQSYFGGAPGLSGVKRLLRATMRLLNGMRTTRQVRS